jgi:hypothetical protein
MTAIKKPCDVARSFDPMLVNAADNDRWVPVAVHSPFSPR